MWWVIFKYAMATVASIILGFVLTTNANAWSSSAVPEFKQSVVKVYNSTPCAGNYGTISVSGEGSVLACSMGENTKVASYAPAQGGVAYAIRFPFQTTYYRLDVCRGVWGCVYAEPTDTLVGTTGVYKHLVHSLTKNVQNGVIHYTPNTNAPVVSVSKFNGKAFLPQTVAASRNGKWALVELRNYGFIRINIQTLEMRRIIAPGIEYGYGTDPRIEMTISNDGNTVALAGLRMGLQVVQINETCGDKLNEFMQTYYTGAVTICEYIPASVSSYIPEFIYALRPIFSQNDKSLSFDVFSHSVAARHITLFSDNDDSQTEPFYLALGDSFTSGEGEIDDSYYLGGAANKCHVSSRSYPFLLANSWKMTAHSTACSGATLQSARGKFAKSNQPLQLFELETHSPQVATVGIGGNDAGLIGKLKDCLGVDTCKWANTAKERRQTALEIKNLYPHLKEFYIDMKVRTLGPVIAVGYPRIITTQQLCLSTVGTLLNQTERVFINEAIQYLNQVIQSAAIDVGIEYVDVENALSGGELCSSFEAPFMNGIRMGDDLPDITTLPFVKIIGAESFHPKPEGHAKVAAKILRSFSNLSTINTYMNNGSPGAAPAPSSYWEAEESNFKPQSAIPFLNKVVIKKKDLFEISFPVFTFKPHTDIVLDLHSEVKKLGTVQSKEDGSLEATISSADFELGFHSVHAIGKDFSDNDIDAYDFIAVEVEDAAIIPSTNNQSTINSSNIQADASPSYRNSSLSSALQSHGPSNVLGASMVTIPNQNIATSTQNEAKPITKSVKTREGFDDKGLVTIGLIAGLIILVIIVYSYNRTKTHL
jgi:lysophospholipase L1-like esterase